MAEFVVSTVASKLSEMVSQELIMLHGVNDEVEWMERELRWIKCFLKDADAKGKKDERVKNWVHDVTDIAYRAEAAMDCFLIKVRRSKSRLGFINRLNPKAWIARHHVGVEISKINKRLNEIKAARETYGIQNLGEDGPERSEDGLQIRRNFSPQSVDPDIVGLFNDQKILLKRLKNHDGQQQVSSVISIVGIGGLGKTTLAWKLYHNSDHFDKRIWLTVSQKSTLMVLLRELLDKIREIEINQLEKMTENDLIDMINDSLRTQTFLIVLDDIWQEWVCIQMQGIFRNLNNGSKVLITTRFLNVAKRADPRSTPYELQLLNDEESMKLLLKKAFVAEEDADADCRSSELLDVGRCLMRKCGGLPLALVVLGGYLSIRDKTPVEWRRVLETMDWKVEGRACQEILALSYEDLPHHMKLCFLYFGTYLEDYEIHGKDLIRKWIAEGFIPQQERKTLEDTAEAILEELIQRSLVHVNAKRSNGTIKTCGVHDLLLDFARSTAKENRFLTVFSAENDQPISSVLSHRIAIHSNRSDFPIEVNTKYDGPRTFMVFSKSPFPYRPFPIALALFRFPFLRVLDLFDVIFVKRITKEIKLLIHLRYLRLYHMNGPKSSIENLQLETIEIKQGPQIHNTLWKIETLRHVVLPLCTPVTPPQSVKLVNLLTLESVTFGSHKTINWSFPNLRKLNVSICKGRHGAMLTNLLSQLGHLISLHIEADITCPVDINTTKDFPFHDRLLTLTLMGIWRKGNTISEFPIYLTKLKLRYSKLEEDPMPKLERLHYLVTLKLYAKVYLGKTMVCSASGFPRLETLFISELTDRIGSKWREEAMPNLEEWSIESGAMPRLNFMRFTSCMKLKMLPDLQHVMSLQTLELYNMSEELMLRSKRETGEDWYKIHHVPKLTLQEHEYSP